MPDTAYSICTTKTFKTAAKITRTPNTGTTGVDKMAEWCNSFVIIPQLNGTGCLCLDPMRLNQALMRPVQRGPPINYILSKLINVCYMTITDVS